MVVCKAGWPESVLGRAAENAWSYCITSVGEGTQVFVTSSLCQWLCNESRRPGIGITELLGSSSWGYFR